MTDTDESRINRRSALALGASAGMVALAGCAEEDDDNGSESSESTPEPPRLPDDPARLDQPTQYILESLAYQNEVLEEIRGEVVE